MGTYGTDWAFWAGNGRFYVKQDGELHAENATIVGNITAEKGTFENVKIGKGCTILGDCHIEGRIWGKDFTVTKECEINARDFGKDFNWFGNAVGSGYIDDELDSKTFKLCVSNGSLGFQSASNYIDASRGNITIQSASAIHIATSAGNVIDCLQDGVTIKNLMVNGNKKRIVKTLNYDTISLSAYETPEPMFGDIGCGQLDEYGITYIWIDPIFIESVEHQYQYKIFLTKYGYGELYVDIENSTKEYFIVRGEPNLKFSWEIKSIQKDMLNKRFEQHDFTNLDMGNGTDYESESDYILKELEGELDYAI